MKKHDFSAVLQILKAGGLVIYPTDTQYALGADIYNETAVRHVFDLKKRPYSVPLPVAVATIPAIETIAIMNPAAHILCQRFLPGTLTIILKKKPTVPTIVTSKQETIAVRIPNNPIALQLLSQFGPLTVTSANLHDEKTLHVIRDIRMQLGTPSLFGLDDGPLTERPSTIVDLTSPTPRVVRKGLITESELLRVLTHG